MGSPGKKQKKRRERLVGSFAFGTRIQETTKALHSALGIYLRPQFLEKPLSWEAVLHVHVLDTLDVQAHAMM